MSDDIFNRLLTGSTGGFVCPALHHLTCRLEPADLRFIPHFFSPNLTHLLIRVQRSCPDPAKEPLPDLGPTLRILPTPCLQKVDIDPGPRGLGHLKDDVDSMIQRCGDSLRVLKIPTPFGEAAVHHIMGLKNLRVWEVHSLPPTTLLFPTTVPPLRSLSLIGKETHGWIPWLTQGRRGTFDIHGGPSGYLELGVTLTHLTFEGSVPINAMFISPFFLLQNLTLLRSVLSCWELVGCGSSLTNKDVVQLSAALPRLEELSFGGPCFKNTCPATVSCFLALSVHCKGLRKLNIHFNTVNLVNDIQTLSEDPDFRDLYSLQTRCPLKYIYAGNLPFPEGTSDEDITTIATGLVDVFPSLSGVLFDRWDWDPLNLKIREFQATRSSSLDRT